MSKAIISSALRVSDYLDKQAIREKEKRKEKILSILPSFIEQQVSGITDKQTLFKTIPRLSADLYAYGPDIGNAANQILGNIAQTKFREIGEIEEKKSAQDIANIISQSVGDKPIEFNGQITNMAGILNQFNEQGIPLTTSSKMLEGIAQRGAFQKKGIVQETKEGTFYREYDFNNLGTERLRNSFKVDRKTSTLDDLSKEGNENLPYTPEVIAWQNKIIEDERNAQQQLNKSITLAKFNQDYQFAKMEEMDLNKIRALRYYDMDTKEQVKADKDKNGTPYFYTEKDEEIVMPGFGMGDTKVKTGKKVRVPVKDVSRLQEIGQSPVSDELKTSEVGRIKTIKNEVLVEAGKELSTAMGWDDEAKAQIKDGDYYDETKIELIYKDFLDKFESASGIDLTEEYNRGGLTDPILLGKIITNKELIPAFIKWQEYKQNSLLYDQVSGQYKGQFGGTQQPTTITKPKW